MENDQSAPKDAIALIEEMAKLRHKEALILSAPGSNHGILTKQSIQITMALRKLIKNA